MAKLNQDGSQKPLKSAQGTIEDKLRNLYAIVRAGKDPDTGWWHITEEDFIKYLQAIITTETTKSVDQKLYELAKMKAGDMHQELQKAYNRVAKRNSRAALQKEQNQ